MHDEIFGDREEMPIGGDKRAGRVLMHTQHAGKYAHALVRLIVAGMSMAELIGSARYLDELLVHVRHTKQFAILREKLLGPCLSTLASLYRQSAAITARDKSGPTVWRSSFDIQVGRIDLRLSIG